MLLPGYGAAGSPALSTEPKAFSGASSTLWLWLCCTMNRSSWGVLGCPRLDHQPENLSAIRREQEVRVNLYGGGSDGNPVAFARQHREEIGSLSRGFVVSTNCTPSISHWEMPCLTTPLLQSAGRNGIRLAHPCCFRSDRHARMRRLGHGAATPNGEPAKSRTQPFGAARCCKT